MIWSQHIGFKLDLRQAKAWILPEPLHLDFCCCFGSVRPLDNPINGSGQESEADIFAQFFTRIQVKCMQEPWTLALPCNEGSYLQLFIFVSKYMKSLFLCIDMQYIWWQILNITKRSKLNFFCGVLLWLPHWILPALKWPLKNQYLCISREPCFLFLAVFWQFSVYFIF